MISQQEPSADRYLVTTEGLARLRARVEGL